jgi:hypothetical protein
MKQPIYPTKKTKTNKNKYVNKNIGRQPKIEITKTNPRNK